MPTFGAFSASSGLPAISSCAMEPLGRAEFGTGEPGDAWRARLVQPLAIREARPARL